MKIRCVRAAVTAVALLAMTATTGPAVSFAQDDVGAPFELTFTDMGIGKALPLNGPDGRSSVTVPVTPGTTPRALLATALVPMGSGRGWLDVSSDGRTLARADLPEGATSVPFSAPLAGLPVVDNAVTLDVSTASVPAAGDCVGARDGTPVTVVDASVAYAGQPTVPATIAEFLPPVLSRLTVYLPDAPDADQSSAAVALSTAIVERYKSQPVRIRLLPESRLDRESPDGPFERSVAISQNTDGSARLIYPTDPSPPTLFVSGSGSALADQVRMITSSVSSLAVSTSASVGALSRPPVLASDTATLDDLGVGTVSGSGSGRVDVTVPIDQTRLGRAAQNVSVHLLGSYTPLPADVGGSVTVTVGDSSLAVLPVDSSGRLDSWVDIPPSVAQRVTDLTVTLATTTAGSGCGTGSSKDLTVDGSTLVTNSADGVPAPGGFASVPQALMPRVDVAMTGQDFADTQRAVTLLAGLQRLSALPLAPQLVSMDDVAGGDAPAVVISPSGTLPDSITLPLRRSGSTTFDVGGPGSEAETSLTLDGAVPYGSLQVAYDSARQRTVVVASSDDAPGELDRILTWLDADPGRWFGLSGDVLFGSAGRDPISLSSADLAGVVDEKDVAATESGSTSNPLVRKIFAAGASLLLVAAVVAAVVVIRGRRRTPPGESTAS
ncbi:membrane protein [Rhodococcoides trifolii]|uniref:Membrane protein n=1 Tax=Rhodococcoides trifolii TaxID=908250 RepID=A0A917G8J2_9NOCA|nr:hypothetical protein [Rhodococcus trifolii]GGG28406.1 membrane protein [Rhodococcus trifolii]